MPTTRDILGVCPVAYSAWQYVPLLFHTRFLEHHLSVQTNCDQVITPDTVQEYCIGVHEYDELTMNTQT